MKVKEFKQHFLTALQHEPTDGQNKVIHKMIEFALSVNERELFLLKGYAGTGKSTLIGALIKSLSSLRKKFVLLAPTGRAAKVLSGYSNSPALTIHKKLYRIYTKKNGSVTVTLNKNLHRNTIFFVDEASMIPDSNNDNNYYNQRNLLNDLIEYVYNGKYCKLVLIGDVAQLPPVGLIISPALNESKLRLSYSIDLFSEILTEVVRQEEASGILYNATSLRNKLIARDLNLPLFTTLNKTQINRINGQDLENLLSDSFNGSGIEKSVMITRSNKRANIYNQEIRQRILFKEDEISAGDYMMVVKNNYFWLDKDSKAGFIANGDIIEVLKIRNIEEQYGFRFADVSIRLVDYPEEAELDVKLLLNTISSESPALTYEENQQFFENVMEDYSDIANRKTRLEKLKTNPYFNALQVKFSYALTCHKTQGGQWETVFVEQGFFKPDMLNIEYLRWLYTAITRATKQLYLVNFNKEFFENEEEYITYD